MSIETFSDIPLETDTAEEVIKEVCARLRRASSLGESVDLEALAYLLECIDATEGFP